jgi:hypothetical protein
MKKLAGSLPVDGHGWSLYKRKITSGRSGVRDSMELSGDFGV